jgi:transcriptional regulator with XRE-family HTH domain
MSKPLDAGRVREIRIQRKLTQEELAKKARLSKESIHRLEKGAQSGNREKTLAGLAKALEVEPGVLTGELPVPAWDGLASEAPDAALFEMYPMNYRVDGAVRNAFTLAALRYQVPMARIVELAPLLFVLAAEASLERRKAKLAELRNAFDQSASLLLDFPHLPTSLCPPDPNAPELDAEVQSISTRDILGARLPDNLFVGSDAIGPNYDESEHNPFVLSLKAEAKRCGGVAVIERFDRDDTTFHVCGKDALELSGGDAKLAHSILSGCVVLHKMPRELFSSDAADKRIAWLREQEQAYHDVLVEALGMDVPADEGMPQ